MLNSSPSLSDTGGFLVNPTPAGVPVSIIVPGGNVVPCDMKDTSFGTENIRSLSIPLAHRMGVV